MLTMNHTVLPATHTFIHKWNEPSCFYSPAAVHQHTLARTLDHPSTNCVRRRVTWLI